MDFTTDGGLLRGIYIGDTLDMLVGFMTLIGDGVAHIIMVMAMVGIDGIVTTMLILMAFILAITMAVMVDTVNQQEEMWL